MLGACLGLWGTALMGGGEGREPEADAYWVLPPWSKLFAPYCFGSTVWPPARCDFLHTFNAAFFFFWNIY